MKTWFIEHSIQLFISLTMTIAAGFVFFIDPKGKNRPAHPDALKGKTGLTYKLLTKEDGTLEPYAKPVLIILFVGFSLLAWVGF